MSDNNNNKAGIVIGIGTEKEGNNRGKKDRKKKKKGKKERKKELKCGENA